MNQAFTETAVMEDRPPQHRCRLCYRIFPTGRALGGHMRSHMLKLPHSQFPTSSSPSSSSSSADTEFSSGSPPIIRSSRTRRRSPPLVSSSDDHSSSVVSDTTPEEYVAHCLIMLSRDTWTSTARATGRTTKVRGRYRCDTCGKKFRSYQALGGHRASHNKQAVVKPPAKVNAYQTAVERPRPHACPFCRRVFSSGQALGGHKRSHFTAAAAAAEPAGFIAKPGSGIGEIDLNLPAPTDDDNNSQVAVSALSEAEFVI